MEAPRPSDTSVTVVGRTHKNIILCEDVRPWSPFSFSNWEGKVYINYIYLLNVFVFSHLAEWCEGISEQGLAMAEVVSRRPITASIPDQSM
jgi:hypothetical protein